MLSESSYVAAAKALLANLGVSQGSQGLWEFTDIQTASESHVHHSQMPAAMAAYAAVNSTFAAGRFPGYLLVDMVSKLSVMDYPEYAALAMACGSPIPSFVSSDARAHVFGQAAWNIVRTYQLEGIFMRVDPPFPDSGDHYSMRPRGIDWAGSRDVIPDDIKALRKTYRAMTPLQMVMVLTIMRLYDPNKDTIFLTGCPTKIPAADALTILRDNAALPAWGHLVTHYAGW